jgi:hypothetical protein
LLRSVADVYRVSGAVTTTLRIVSTASTPQKSPSNGASNVPAALKLAAAIVLVEGAAVGAFGILEAFALRSNRLVMGLTTSVFLLLYGVGLAVLARGLARAVPWSRGPAVFTQLVQLGVAWSFWGGSTTWVAVLLAVAALAVLLALFRRTSREALLDNPTRP